MIELLSLTFKASRLEGLLAARGTGDDYSGGMTKNLFCGWLRVAEAAAVWQGVANSG